MVESTVSSVVLRRSRGGDIAVLDLLPLVISSVSRKLIST